MQALTRRCCSHLRSGSLSVSKTPVRQWPSSHSINHLYITHPSWLTRRNHDAATATSATPPKAAAVVIGGGPAGIAAVGNLLEAIPNGNVVWVDKAFEGGSIGQLYREVPSYSPAGDFLRYARALDTFRSIADAAPQPNAITTLQSLDPEMTCPLTYAADMLTLLTSGLSTHPRVTPVTGTVAQAVRNPRTKQWTITLEPPLPGHTEPNSTTLTTTTTTTTTTTYHTPLVVYCTGTRPLDLPLPLPTSRVPPETGLSPTRLAKLLPADERRTVAVIGDGHVAVLTLRNLFRLAAVSHRRLRIKWLTRSAHLKYAAEDGEEGGGGVVRNEFDGLMGEAAWFARNQLEGARLEEGGVGRFVERVVLPSSSSSSSSSSVSSSEGAVGGGGGGGGGGKGSRAKQRDKEREAAEAEVLRRELEGVDYVFQCIGFARARLPEVRPGLGVYGGPLGKPKKLVFNPLTGSFFPNWGMRDQVIGLYGAGSAFPESVFTSEGWRKPAVGVWRFMSFLQKMVPRWVDATKRGWFISKEPRGRREARERYHEYY